MTEKNNKQPRPPRTPREQARRILRQEGPPGGYIQHPNLPYTYGGDLSEHDPNQKVHPEAQKKPAKRKTK